MVNISLYFHIPFCKRKCDYCHFYVIPDKDIFKQKLRSGFKKEWILRQNLLKFPYASIYFGGGTPSLFGSEAIGEILSWITPLPSEITLEVNPEHCSPALIKAYANAGITRISLGAQSFDQKLLTLLSRTHQSSHIKESIFAIKNAGIHNISIDLMYDLPSQTLKSWEKTLETAISLPITHLSLYNLSIEPHTVFYKYKENIEKQMPKASISLAMLNLAVEAFSAAGFERYEISAFAKKGYQSIHNVGYWTGRPFLGFGPSASSYIDGCRFKNISNLHRYCKLLDEGSLPVDFSETLPREQQAIENLILRLRVLEPFSLSQFESKWGKLPIQTHQSLIKLFELGIIHYENGHLSLTEKGILYHDSCAVELV